ncbi:hypothetical protein DID88_006854 [Monilinia fructigena]|uniref:Receptor L-domain domain-containing protein n=1 Tax=Monilinia fructigena TaxID=38457 RepID=A0A395IHI6_9HELO|nr:hypothetical protein DID88_006854 [Monilinia fructigena]
MFSKALLPALAVVGTAAAATNSICSQATATINSAADATALADCTTIKGDVLVSTTAPGIINLDGPEEINGDLMIENNGAITSFSSSSLTTITGTFGLSNLTLLSTLQFAVLDKVGTINWAALPLSHLLPSPTPPSAHQVGNVTTLLNIDSNGKNLDVSFPNLIWAANMTFRNVSSVSIPSLAVVNGSSDSYENYFTSLNAKLDIKLLVVLSKLPTTLLFGGISFPKLTQVGGAIDFSGNFTTPELPKLNDVKGGFNMQSTTSIDCSGFKSEHDSGNIQGTYTCKTTANAQSGTSSSSSSSSSSSATASKGAAVSYGVNEAVMGVSVVGSFLEHVVVNPWDVGVFPLIVTLELICHVLSFLPDFS